VRERERECGRDRERERGSERRHTIPSANTAVVRARRFHSVALFAQPLFRHPLTVGAGAYAGLLLRGGSFSSHEAGREEDGHQIQSFDSKEERNHLPSLARVISRAAARRNSPGRAHAPTGRACMQEQNAFDVHAHAGCSCAQPHTNCSTRTHHARTHRAYFDPPPARERAHALELQHGQLEVKREHGNDERADHKHTAACTTQPHVTSARLAPATPPRTSTCIPLHPPAFLPPPRPPH